MARNAIVGALRTTGDEYELTQTIAAFASADAVFAAELARTLIEAAPLSDPALLAAIPAEVRCTPEYRLYDGPVDRGPIDLLFEEADWALLVEHKLYSDYGYDQIERYLQGGAALKRQHWGLLAVTREVPAPAEEPPVGTTGWLGSIRWRDIYEALRRTAPADQELKSLWESLIHVEIENGDFGVININPEAVRGWAVWQTGRNQLARLLVDLVKPTLDALNRQLPAGRSCKQDRHTSSTGLWVWDKSIHARFSVPSNGRERLRIQFYSDWDQPLFIAEARHDDFRALGPDAQDQYRSIARLLCDRHAFEADERNYTYIAHRHPADRWLRDEGLESAALLRAIIEDDIERLAQAGSFDERFDVTAP